MATTEIASNRPVVCPLARDADGNPLELPQNASAWRVRRHTGGRPRIVLGADKQPMLVPLAYTVVDLEDILAPGVYRPDLVDGKGEPIPDMTVPVSINQLRNADDAEESVDEAQSMPSLPSSGSEVRLVLEANVRSTQMAFAHNQKTLELGMRMAETLRDSVRAMAESQADWIKSMASARGFFRNASPPQLPPPPPAEKSDDDEDEYEDDAPPSQPSWVEAITPIVATVSQQVIQAVMGFAQKPKAPANGETKFEIGDALDWRRPAAKAAAAKLEPPPPFDLQAFVATLPPLVVAKLMALKEKLSSAEIQKALQLISLLEPDMRTELVARVETMSVDETANYLRAQIASPAA
jgi:hypothetical protein